MTFSWSTFILEMINFLALVWILKHFFYKPVLAVITRRRQAIEQIRADALKMQDEAEKLQQQYQGRLEQWQNERQKMSQAMAVEIEAERSRKLIQLKNELDVEREKAAASQANQQTELINDIEQTALRQAAHFASHLLQLTAGEGTHNRLIDWVVKQIDSLSEARLAEVFKRPLPVSNINIVSAYPLSKQQQQKLEKALLKINKSGSPIKIEVNKELLAGIRISFDGLILGFNLLDELKAMVELADLNDLSNLNE